MKKNLFKNKNFIRLVAITVIGICMLLGLTGCNQQIIDWNYTYDKAICTIGGEIKEIKIDQWNDYEGEQLQIIDEEGNKYLASSYTCILVKEK